MIVKGHKLIGHEEDEHYYDSILESRMATLLLKHRVRFFPHRTFRCVRRDGSMFTYEVDFVFEIPLKFAGISMPVNGLEVKGVLKPHDFTRVDALKYSHHIRIYNVLSPLIEFWERNGMFWPETAKLGEPRS